MRIGDVVMMDGCPAIVTEINGPTCCVTVFRPRSVPVHVDDIPWFEARYQADEWLESRSRTGNEQYVVVREPDDMLDMTVHLRQTEADIDRILSSIK